MKNNLQVDERTTEPWLQSWPNPAPEKDQENAYEVPAYKEKHGIIDAGDLEIRQKLDGLEKFLSGFEQYDFELKHTFTDGVYIREILLPAGSMVVGKIHRHDHFNFLSKGRVTVYTKDGLQTFAAPMSMVSTAGTKRAVYAHTDAVWTTIHHNPTNTQDLEEIEGFTIAPTYEALQSKGDNL